MTDIPSLLCAGVAGGSLVLLGGGLMLRLLNIKLVTHEPPRPAETVAPTLRSSTPPPPLGSLASTASVNPGTVLSRGPRVLQSAVTPPRQPNGFLVRLLLDFKGERISIPLAFDENAIADSLSSAPATIGAGAEGDESETLQEIFDAVGARGTPPTRISMELLDHVPKGMLLFGSAAHLKADLHAAIPVMSRIMGEIWFSQEGDAMFSARKGLSPAGLLVERIVAGEGGKPVTFSSAVPPMKIPDGGIVVRQIAGFSGKEAGHAPIPSGLAWEIVPSYS